MLLTGTPVTVDRQGTIVPVERIEAGQTLWNPLTDAGVEVLRVLRRRVDPATDLPATLRPHILPRDALGPGQPAQPLRVLPALRCLRPVPVGSGRMALQVCSLADEAAGLVPLVEGKGQLEVLLPVASMPTLIDVAGLVICL